MSLDRNERVLYVGSLSKALAPGLRLGYVVAPAPVIRELRALRRLMLRHPPLNNQRVAALFIGLGHYRSHLQRVSRVLLERAHLLDRLLPELLAVLQLVARGWQHQLLGDVPPGHRHYGACRGSAGRGRGDRTRRRVLDGCDGTRHCFRLGFSSIRIDRIEPGIERLGRLIARR